MCFIGMTNNNTIVLPLQWQVRQQFKGWGQGIRIWLVRLGWVPELHNPGPNASFSIDRNSKVFWRLLKTWNVLRFVSREGFETFFNLTLSLSLNRVPMFRNVGNGVRPHRRLSDHSLFPHRAHMGVRERSSADQPFGMDVVATAPAVHGRVATDRFGRGEIGQRIDHPGRQTPW